MSRHAAVQEDTTERVVTIFTALHAATPPIEQPLRVNRNRKLQKRLNAYDQALRESSYQTALAFGLDEETAAEIADDYMARTRRGWSAALDTLAALPP